MLLTGRTQGEYAERYPEFCYFKPILPPRWTAIVTVWLLDYTIDILPVSGLPNHIEGTKLTLYLEPNEYTQAKKRKRALQIMVQDFNEAQPGKDEYIDMMLKAVFGF